MKVTLILSGLFVILSVTGFSQETQRKPVKKPLVKKIGDYVFTSQYEPYFVNDYYYSYYGADDQWFYDFADGNLIVHRVQETSAGVIAIHKWVVDILRLDTSRIFYDYNNYGKNTGKKKYTNLGSIEYRIGEKYHYTEKGVTHEGDGKLIDMDFENYAQFTSFCFELRKEWRVAAATYTHIKVLNAMDDADMKNYGRPYILRMLNDTMFKNFAAILPYVQKAKLGTYYKDEPLYNLILIAGGIKNKETFCREYYKYDSNVNVQNANGVSPLMLCIVVHKDSALASLLLKLGANPLAQNKDHKTAYDYARSLQNEMPYLESMLRQAVLSRDYLLETKLQFCTDYNLGSDGASLLLAETQKFPDSLQLHFRRAAWNFNTKQYTAAVNAYTECIRLNKQEARFYFSRALCFYGLKMNEKADRDFEEAVRLKPFYKSQIETAKKQLSEQQQ